MMFTVPDEVARRLAAAATARGVPVEDAVVEALTEWTRHHPAPDLAERHDDVLEAFIGCAASGTGQPFDIGRERAAAADAKLARGA